MTSKYYYILVILLLVATATVSAQHQSGLRMENYAGINSIFINPASANIFPLRWDLNLVSADFFIDNNAAYISNTKVGDLVKNANLIKSGWEMEPQGDQTLVADFYRDTTKNKYAMLSQTINGPAFLFNTNGGQSIGLFYNFRSTGGSPKIPGSLNYYNYISKSANEIIDFPSFDFSFMAWDEIGVHFSQRVSTVDGYASVGINIKSLRGYEAAYISLQNQTDIQFLNSNQVEVSDLNIQYGLTNHNVDIADNQSYNRTIAGKGLGIDLGFNYVIEDDSDTYKFRVGASINDIGRIKFKNNAEVHRLEADQSIIFDEALYQSFTTLDEAMDQASIDLYGAIDLSEVDEDLKVGLPTNFSLQADYKIVDYIYVSALLINRISFSPYAVKTTNFLSLAPRFEHRWGMFTLPISIVEYSRVKMGLALRLGYFIIGTDDLTSITGTKEFRGTDIYFGVKVNPFQIGDSNPRKGRSGSSGKRSKVKCYKF